MSGRRVLLLAGCLASFWARPAGADILHLTNGNTIHGIILRENASGVTIRLGPKMTMHLAPHEIARLDREGPKADAALRATWQRPSPSPAARRTPAEDAAPQADARGESDLPLGEPAEVTEEQRWRDEAISEIDIAPEHNSRADIEADVGPPQRKERGTTKNGEDYEDWVYDVGGGQVRVVRFVKGRWGYFVASANVRPATAEAPAGAAD